MLIDLFKVLVLREKPKAGKYIIRGESDPLYIVDVPEECIGDNYTIIPFEHLSDSVYTHCEFTSIFKKL